MTVMEKHKVFSRVEMHSRYEISLEKYIKTINIEAMTMLEMAKRQLLPACIKFETEIAKSINEIKNCGIEADLSANTDLLKETASFASQFKKEISLLENSLSKAQNSFEDTLEQAMFYRNDVFARMEALRTVADELERIVDSNIWPIPTYADILFNI